MPNHATEADLDAYLSQQLNDVKARIDKVTREVAATAAKRGMLNSSSRIIMNIQATGSAFSEWISELVGSSANWNGPHLTDQLVRQRHCDAFRRAIADYFPDQSAPGSSLRYEQVQAPIRESLESKIRIFEIGVLRPATAMQPAIFNIVHAANVAGGIQQAGGSATQTNSVTLTSVEIESAIERLSTVLQQHGLAEIQNEIEPELSTIRIQLAKAEPNSTILQEAGKTVRSVVEGAAGGAIGAAATPALLHALAMFGAALGLA